MTTRRLEAFSDGVFAIAITLLILDVHVPEDMTHAAAALRAQWPSYLGYAVSFAVIGIIWTNHHAALAYVGRVDRGFQYLNLMLLAAVAFIPFPTALLARALQDGEGERVAAAVYGGASTAMGLSFGALWLYAVHRPGILRQALPQTALAAITRRFVTGGPVYGLSIVLALTVPSLCLLVYGLLAVYYAIPGRGGIPDAIEQYSASP